MVEDKKQAQIQAGQDAKLILENPQMVAAFNEVSSMMKSKKTSMRMAAFAVAIDRVAKSFELRGV